MSYFTLFLAYICKNGLRKPLILTVVSLFDFQLTIMAYRFFENISNLTENEKNRLSNQFNKYILKSSDCHLWHGRTDRYGYGQIRIVFRGSRIDLKAHRVILALTIPDQYMQYPDHDVSHLCFSRNCVNFNHLSLEPHIVNNKRLICKNEGNCCGHYGFPECHV